MAYFVYVLRSKQDGGFYVGSSQNVLRRVREHNRGKTRSVKHRRPLELVYDEKFSEAQLARRREKQLKSFKGGSGFKRLLERRGARAVEWARLESG